MRIRVLCLLLMLLAAMAVGCSSGLPANGSESPAGLTGGDEELGGSVNLKEVSVEMQGEATLVHLNFINGSRNAGVEETKLSAVPQYAIRELYDPPRLEIDLAIAYSDYADTGAVFQGSVVDGLFDCEQTEENIQQVFLQLSSPVDISASVEGATLSLSLTPREEEPHEAFYVGLNAIEGYENGLVPEDLKLTPTMCEGYSNIILISEPLSSSESVQDLLEEVAAQLPETIPQSALYTFEMFTNALPPFGSTTDLAVASSIAVIERDDKAELLPVLIDNGTYLATGPDGSIFYSVPYTPRNLSDSEAVLKEELWTRDPHGEEARCGRRTFYDIKTASVSYDGRYVGILDAQTSRQILYVYDTWEGTLQNLGEEGLGSYTASFFWMPDENTIYAMTGTNTSLQLLRCDFDDIGGAPSITSVEERSGMDSQISYANGHIYFADQETMTVYMVDIQDGTRTPLCEGIRCLVSPDGRYLAVLQMHMVDEVEMLFDLVLVNAQTGEIEDTVKKDGIQIEDFMFAPNSSTLYFTSQDSDEVNAEYPFALLGYSQRKLSLLCTSRTERIFVSPREGTLYLIYSFATGKETAALIPVTYTLNLG